VRAQAIQEFLEDLFAGDPVALGLLGVILLIGAVICTAWFFIARAKRREDRELAERKKRRGY
jgi:hypothetical protein